MLCEYAFNEKHELVHVDSVPNGLACNCTCPCCKAQMEAKNDGKIRDHHFAHYDKKDCEGYYETVMHMLAKEIIAEEKCIMLPEYKDTQYNGLSILNESTLEYNYIDFKIDKQIIKFETVEVEQRNDLSDLQPDIVGVTEDGLRLWIEIVVTHKCDDNKIQKIKNNNINCIEIQIPKDIVLSQNKDKLKQFLLNDDGIVIDKWYEKTYFKKIINYPYGDLEIQKQKEEKYLQLKEKYSNTSVDHCKSCFTNIILQKSYENLLEENKELSTYKEFGYIFRYKKLIDLINKYPKLVNLGYALSHTINTVNEDDKKKLEFGIKLGNLIKTYNHIINYNYDINCYHLVAYDNKGLRLCSSNISTALFD